MFFKVLLLSALVLVATAGRRSHEEAQENESVLSEAVAPLVQRGIRFNVRPFPGGYLVRLNTPEIVNPASPAVLEPVKNQQEIVTEPQQEIQQQKYPFSVLPAYQQQPYNVGYNQGSYAGYPYYQGYNSIYGGAYPAGYSQYIPNYQSQNYPLPAQTYYPYGAQGIQGQQYLPQSQYQTGGQYPAGAYPSLLGQYYSALYGQQYQYGQGYQPYYQYPSSVANSAQVPTYPNINTTPYNVPQTAY